MADERVDAAVTFVIDNWDVLGVEEQGGVLYMPASIKRRTKKGGIDGVPVMLRNVTNEQKFKSRVRAREYSKSLQFDLDRDARLIDEIENYAILAYAIREPKAPYDQHVPGVHELLGLYDTQSLAELWGRYNVWVEMLDPRFGELTGEQLWQAIARVATEKNPSFLAGMPGHAQFSCIVGMAVQALHSPNRPSWLQPPGISKLAS